MTGRLGTILAAASLLLCGLCLLGWARSKFPARMLIASRGGGLVLVGIGTSAESMRAQYGDVVDEVDLLLEFVERYRQGFQRFGFIYAENRGSPPYKVVAIPYWFLVLLTAAWPVAWYVLLRRRRSRRRA